MLKPLLQRWWTGADLAFNVMKNHGLYQDTEGHSQPRSPPCTAARTAKARGKGFWKPGRLN